MFRKRIALLLAVLMLLSFCVSCGGNANPETTEEETRPVAVIDIVADGVTEYKVMRSENAGKDRQAEIDAAVRLRKAIEEGTGANPEIVDDWLARDTSPAPTAKEILVGLTNRTESADANTLLREKDFVISYENERVIILGGSPSATDRAVDYFIEHYIDTAAKKISVPENLKEIVPFDYPVGNVTFSGTPLSEYRIVYPENCDKITYNVALNLFDYLKANGGIELDVVSDKEAETECELLVGETNREATTAAYNLLTEADEYVLYQSGKKIVLYGDYYMSGAAASVLIHDYFTVKDAEGKTEVNNLPTAPAKEKFTFPEARNAIMIIGDGMGRMQVESTVDCGKIAEFVGDRLPNVNYCTTYSQSVKNGSANYTDSAAAATALATGFKTINGYIGVDPKKVSHQNLRELAASVGARTSILTTDVITGATPAGFLAHQGSRNDTSDIQKQIDAHVKEGSVQYCKGSVGDALYDCTRESLQLIAEDGSRFFTMIEEAYPDKGGHNKDMNKMQTGVIRLNDAAAYAIGFVMMHPDTVLLITADHETGGLTKNADGTYKYSGTNHTNRDVPVYALGAGTETLLAEKTDNILLSKFVAKVFGAETWGQ